MTAINAPGGLSPSVLPRLGEGRAPASESPIGDNKAPRSASVVVTLSPSAAASQSDAAKATNALLDAQGADLFQNALSGIRQHPTNLATVLDDPKTSDADYAATNEAMQARERAAFGHLSGKGGSAYARAYIEFYDSLSPEEQNSARYRGTREHMVAFANAAAAKEGADLGDLSKSQDPIAMLFEKIRQTGFKLTEENLESFLNDYRREVGGLMRADENASVVDQAVAAVRDVQALIEQARGGDPDALASLSARAAPPQLHSRSQ